MKRITSTIFLGSLLIVVGILILLNQYSIVSISWENIWPIFILLPGILLESSYFMNRSLQNAKVLVPGGILIVVGIFLFFSVFTDFEYMEKLWPIFILAPAFGLFQLYIFGGKQRELLTPVFILGLIGMTFLLINIGNFGINLLGIMLVILGVTIIYHSRRI